MPYARRLLLAALLTVAGSLAGCDVTAARDPSAQIDIRPSYAVRYATSTISPAVVQLDVVSEVFSQGQPISSQATGSGVIIDKEGHILTNFHVAGRAKRIIITLANQEHVRAKLVGSDHWTDLALVQLDMDEIKRKNLTFTVGKLGSSADVALGEQVMAVGTPYGLTRTITGGIVSNTDRTLEDLYIDGYETGWFNNWLQTDAAINPGNSGGPLINLRGEVVGINTRGVNEGNNLGFAIPIDTAKEVANELLAHKKVTRSYLGITLQPLQDLEKFYDLQDNHGVLIVNIEKDSPAAAAGLQIEDILLAVNGTPVNARFPEQLASVRKLISDYPVGSRLALTVRRGNGQLVAATRAAATAGTEPAQTPPATRPVPMVITATTDKLESRITEERAIAAWGISVRDLTRAYLRELQLPKTEGVLVTGFRPGSRADRASIKRGDIILRVNDKNVTNVDEFEAAVAKWEEKPEPVGVDVSRDRGQITLVVKP